jgi:hypothetical protein
MSMLPLKAAGSLAARDLAKIPAATSAVNEGRLARAEGLRAE